MDERHGTDQGLKIIGILIAGPLFYGGIGWVVDRVLGTSWGLPVGLVAGVALGAYWVTKKYGTKP